MSQQKSKKTLINWDLVSVNPNDKNWDWKDLFYFWGVNIQSIIGFSLIASLYFIYDLNSFVVFFGTVLGSLLVYFFSNWIGKPSQKFGLPFVVLLRSSLGINGSRFIGLIRCLVGVFMFGIQTYFLKGVVPEWDLKDIYYGMMQFMVLQVIGLILIIVFPQIALWLPTLLYGQ